MFYGYDFFDFGCSIGGNIRFVKSILGDVKGLGIDVDQEKIEKARLNGHDAILLDILKIPNSEFVDFVTMSQIHSCILGSHILMPMGICFLMD